MAQPMAFPTGLPTNKIDVKYLINTGYIYTPEMYLQYTLPITTPPIYFGSAPDLGGISYNYSTDVWEFYAYVIPGGWTATPLRVSSIVEVTTPTLLKLDFSNALGATYTYNGDGTLATKTIGGVVYTYSYNGDGTLATKADGTSTWTYNYNAGGELTSVVKT